MEDVKQSTSQNSERSLSEILLSGLKTVAAGTVDVLADRIVPQGASEISQALFSDGNAYVPYGTGQQPLEVPQAENLYGSAQQEGQTQDRGGRSM